MNNRAKHFGFIIASSDDEIKTKISQFFNENTELVESQNKILTVSDVQEWRKIIDPHFYQHILDINLGSDKEREGINILWELNRLKTSIPPIVYTKQNDENTKKICFMLGVAEENYIIKTTSFESDLHSITTRIVAQIDVPNSKATIKKGALITFPYHPDTLAGEDQLNIESDVNAITNLIVNKQVKPPLSISILGNWGKGKSFFMKKMEERINFIANIMKEGSGLDDNIFIKDPLSIHFNAWHYTDANLWSNLFAKILQGILDHLGIEYGSEKEINELFEEKGIFKIIKDTPDIGNIIGLTKKDNQNQPLDPWTEKIINNEYKIKQMDQKDFSFYLPLILEYYYLRLGLISSIRKDLQYINTKFEKGDLRHKDKSIDRIILFIDDLDRCPPQRVIEVLQAIHLLLSFPLFVVVAGVDINWIIQSITKTYPNITNTTFYEEEDSILKSDEIHAPFNYLEKIFQVFYSLKKMNEEDTVKLINSLIKEDIDSKAGNKGHLLKEENPISTEQNTKTSDSDKISSLINSFYNATDLRIPEDEIVHIRTLAPFLKNSPRSVKRFINTYRIIRSHDQCPEAKLEKYGILLLLGIMVGFPDFVDDIFKKIENSDEKEKDKSFKDWFSSIKSVSNQEIKEKEAFSTIKKYLDTLSSNSELPKIKLSDIKPNISLVSRFSLQRDYRIKDKG
ncbi:MAG: hypothetical protein HUU45_12225 [Leptospiraceae bacterium]|nr:hypothetical protein [Leptospiraceae bacterium]